LPRLHYPSLAEWQWHLFEQSIYFAFNDRIYGDSAQAQNADAGRIVFRAEQQEEAISVKAGSVDRGLRIVIGSALIAFAISTGLPNTG
jgi:hypothetical protein